MSTTHDPNMPNWDDPDFLRDERDEARNLLEKAQAQLGWAIGIISNVDAPEAGWPQQSDEWRSAARQWLGDVACPTTNEWLREAETERDALLEAAKAQVESERGHEHGQIGPDPACYFCEEPWPCPTERLRRTVALILTGEAEADG